MNFSQIPNSLLVPGFWTEFDNSAAAGSGIMPWTVLLIGSMLSGGSAEANVPVQIFSDDEADNLFGEGSQTALMVRAFRKNNPLMPLWAVGVADGTTKATLSVTFTGTATAAGVVSLYVAGQNVNIAVASGDTASDVADAVVAAITANMPVTASASSGVVTFTAKNGGTAGNYIDVRVNYVAGEVLPAGISVSGTGLLTGGAGDPSISDVIANIGAQWFNIIVTAFSASGTLTALKEELEDRWSATNQKTGVAIFGDNSDNARTVAGGLNSQVLVELPLPKSPTPSFEIAAAGAAVIAQSAEADPAMPLGNLSVKGVLAPAMKDRKNLNEENAMLLAGGSLINAAADGTVYLRRTVTTYKTNAAGAEDDSYQQLETIFTLSFIRWDWNNYMASKYPRAKLAGDSYEYGEGQVIITPKKGRAEALSRFDYWQQLGVAQDAETFKQYLVVEINAQNPYRLDFLLPATLMKQLFTVATKLQFR
jgi:phage tail sheath gpL-like